MQNSYSSTCPKFVVDFAQSLLHTSRWQYNSSMVSVIIKLLQYWMIYWILKGILHVFWK